MGSVISPSRLNAAAPSNSTSLPLAWAHAGLLGHVPGAQAVGVAKEVRPWTRLDDGHVQLAVAWIGRPDLRAAPERAGAHGVKRTVITSPSLTG